ncbi:MAG: ATP synthase F1 subunit epsilon [Coprobacillus sp.]|nr:ATP synthase F1 subunit epsilon [Coprobacillus sp.]
MPVLNVEIYTPTKKYLTMDASLVSVQSDNYRLGILPEHAEMISTVAISELDLKDGENTYRFAVGKGVLHVKKDKVTILVDSIESDKEIDVSRALLARERALHHLSKKDPTVDLDRAQQALDRALNRLKVANYTIPQNQ